MLPELDGLSLLSIIRRRGIHTPVIMATALDGLGERIDGLDAGADDYIVKPFAIKELLASIRAITRRPGRFENFREFTFTDLTLKIPAERCFLYCCGLKQNNYKTIALCQKQLKNALYKPAIYQAYLKKYRKTYLLSMTAIN